MQLFENPQHFSFTYGGIPFWNLEMETRTTTAGDERVWEYRLPDGLTVRHIVTLYPAYGACQWVTWFRNDADTPSQLLTDLCDCDLRFPLQAEPQPSGKAFLPGKDTTRVYNPIGSLSIWRDFSCCDEFYDTCLRPGDSRRYTASGGRSSQARSPFFDVSREGAGIFFAIGWTGQWCCQLSRDESHVGIRTGIEDACFRLLPGEEIRTSSVVLMPYADGRDAARNRWRRLVGEHFSLVGQPGRDAQAPLCACLWGGMPSDQMIEKIRYIGREKLGYEYIWIDAGWYGDSTGPCLDEFEGDWAAHTGDWRVNPTYHPDGLAEVAAAVREEGMKLLLWVEPERVIKGTPITREHPDYLLPSPYEGDANLLLNLGNEEAWQYCFETLSGLIERLNISCYRQDFNMDPLAFWRAEDSEDRRGMTEIRHILGLYRLWDALLERFPTLIIDNCASGGRRIDIETLRRSVPLWRSDLQCPANPQPEGTQNHCLSYGCWMPYSGTGQGRIWGDVYHLRSAYSPGLAENFWYSAADPCRADPVQADWIRRYNREYKLVRPYLSRDFYPLTPAAAGDDAWCVLQYDRPEEGDGVVLLFRRPESPCRSARYLLGGLRKDASYRLTDMDTQETFALTGSELTEEGLPVEIPEKRASKLYRYQIV